MKCKIIGCGSYLPEKIVSNSELEKLVNTDDAWIRSRTGISQRHIAAADEFASHLALKAAQQAILDANIKASDIELIIVCTTTPDNSFPSTATKLQGYLSLLSVPSFDLQAVCSGFVYGLQVANSLIKSKQYKTILLVSAEKMSSLLDWNDRSTCVLFGDGAGAVVLQESSDSSEVIDSKIYSDGAFGDILYTDGGVSSNGQSGKIRMKGPALFKQAIEKMSNAALEILKVNNINIQEIDHFIPHQANTRIINVLADHLSINQNKIVNTISKHANCSAASIPLALHDLNNSEKLKRGELILFVTFGAGLTWGAALVRW